jgi:hypothetical protein
VDTNVQDFQAHVSGLLIIWVNMPSRSSGLLGASASLMIILTSILIFDDCFRDGIFKSPDEFRELGLNLPLSLWMQLQSAIIYSKKINRYDSDVESEGKNIADFLSKIKRGSKKFRQTIDNLRYLGDCPVSCR